MRLVVVVVLLLLTSPDFPLPPLPLLPAHLPRAGRPPVPGWDVVVVEEVYVVAGHVAGILLKGEVLIVQSWNRTGAACC